MQYACVYCTCACHVLYILCVYFTTCCIQAELEWLKLQERDLKSKGADDQMPPLRKREEGLLKKLQQEQVCTIIMYMLCM